MTPEVILGLVNLGAAGAVIIVVIVFIKYMERKDTTLSAAIEKVSSSVDANTKILVQLQANHDNHQQDTRRLAEQNTQPIKKEKAWN